MWNMRRTYHDLAGTDLPSFLANRNRAPAIDDVEQNIDRSGVTRDFLRWGQHQIHKMNIG